jgi:hypothetical protein
MRILLSLIVLLVSCQPPSEGMGVPQSPSATPTFPTTITPPVNGDGLDAPTLNVNVETPLQNGVEAARLLTYGGGTRWRVKCTGNNALTIQPMGAVIPSVSSVFTAKAMTTGVTIDPAALAGALAANTRYYVYVSLVSGSLTWSVSTTAPDAGYFYKTGDTSYQFVSTFYTDHVPNILLYSQTDRKYTYKSRTTGGIRGNMILNAGTSNVPADVVVTPSVPADAGSVLIQAYATSTEAPNVGNVINFSGFPAASFDPHSGASIVASTAGYAAAQFEVSLTDGISYTVTNAAKDTASAWIAGFTL